MFCAEKYMTICTLRVALGKAFCNSFSSIDLFSSHLCRRNIYYFKQMKTSGLENIQLCPSLDQISKIFEIIWTFVTIVMLYIYLDCDHNHHHDFPFHLLTLFLLVIFQRLTWFLLVIFIGLLDFFGTFY